MVGGREIVVWEVGRSILLGGVCVDCVLLSRKAFTSSVLLIPSYPLMPRFSAALLSLSSGDCPSFSQWSITWILCL